MKEYELKEQIAAGGMGEIYRGEHKGTGGFSRPVAIKKMRPDLSRDPRFAEMFLREGRIVSRLRHANIVPVLDMSRDDRGALLLVMELVDGVDLSRLVKSGMLPVQVAVYIVIEMLRGLGYAHDCRDADGRLLELVHRDVTPRNVMITWDGAVQILDFGLAKTYASLPPEHSNARGTLPYTSPEQVEGHPLDKRSDLFSVGVILYKLLTGELPFPGEGQAALVMAVLQHSVRPPRELVPALPQALDSIVMQLLSRDRGGRPASAQQVIDALFACDVVQPRARDDLAALLRERFAAEGAPELAVADQSTPRADLDAAIRAELPAAAAAIAAEALRVTERRQAVQLVAASLEQSAARPESGRDVPPYRESHVPQNVAGPAPARRARPAQGALALLVAALVVSLGLHAYSVFDRAPDQSHQTYNAPVEPDRCERVITPPVFEPISVLSMVAETAVKQTPQDNAPAPERKRGTDAGHKRARPMPTASKSVRRSEWEQERGRGLDTWRNY